MCCDRLKAHFNLIVDSIRELNYTSNMMQLGNASRIPPQPYGGRCYPSITVLTRTVLLWKINFIE